MNLRDDFIELCSKSNSILLMFLSGQSASALAGSPRLPIAAPAAARNVNHLENRIDMGLPLPSVRTTSDFPTLTPTIYYIRL